MRFFKKLKEWINIALLIKSTVFPLLILAIGYIQKVTGFFTIIVCVQTWVIMAIPVTICSIAIFIFYYHQYKISKAEFKPGEEVNLRNHITSFIVSGYSFFRPGMVKCYRIENGNVIREFFPVKVLEKYKSTMPTPIISSRQSHNRF